MIRSSSTPALIALSGLPGVGKTSLARAIARKSGAFVLRIDAIETGITTSSLGVRTAEEAGYLAAYNLASENLNLGFSVIADSVNPIRLTRDAWAQVARESNAYLMEVEVVCSDKRMHRKRVEQRVADLHGAVLPDWDAVTARHYEPWEGERLIIDTASRTEEECALEVLAAWKQKLSDGTVRR